MSKKIATHNIKTVKVASQVVGEPHRSANVNWYENALQDFWRLNEKANVIETGNEDYARPNVGGGSTRGQNAHNIIKNGKVIINKPKCKNVQLGDCVWTFTVISQGSKGSPQKFQPMIALKPTRTKNEWLNGQQHTVASVGEVVSWACQCNDYKFRKSVCKHILASSLALRLRVQGVKSGRIK